MASEAQRRLDEAQEAFNQSQRERSAAQASAEQAVLDHRAAVPGAALSVAGPGAPDQAPDLEDWVAPPAPAPPADPGPAPAADPDAVTKVRPAAQPPQTEELDSNEPSPHSPADRR